MRFLRSLSKVVTCLKFNPMTKTLYASFAILVILLASSCQKEVSSSNRPDTPTTAGDTTQLLKYYEIDSIPGEAPDTSLIITFSYDAAGRLIEDDVVFSTDPLANSNLFEMDQYFYQNADTLPYKHHYYSIEGADPNNLFLDTFFYTYNSTGTLVADSIFTVNGTNPIYAWKNTYDYQAGYIIRHTTDTTSITDTIYQTYQGGNLTSQDNTLYSPGNAPVINNFVYSYDNHPNPFNITGYTKTRFIAYFEDDSYNTPQKNNPVSCSQSFTSGGIVSTNNIQYSYSYKTNGYPSVVYIVYPGTNGNETRYVKGIFEYGIR